MPIQIEGDILFNDSSLDDLVEHQIAKALNAVEEQDVNVLLSVPVDDQVNQILDRFQLLVPKLDEDNARIDEPQETMLSINDYGRQIRVPSFRYVARIPFEGHLGLFRHRPSPHNTNPPAAKAYDRELIISLVGYNVTSPDEVDQQIYKIVSKIKQFLNWQRSQVDRCSDRIRELARKRIEDRKAGILQSRNIAASLKYPLKQRSDAPITYVTSELRRKITPVVRRPASVAAAFTPEPTIDETDYQHILNVMSGMALMMERSPDTFVKLGEEEIRDFFLLVLNGHYEGKATGETFNAAGKTDILVRHGDRNLFIGECKIWGGGKLLTDAIDQLLGYLTWRDTKSAVLVFSKNKNFTGVLDSIKTVVEQHPQKKTGPTLEDETRFRYVFGKPDDPNREIIITFMAFSVR